VSERPQTYRCDIIGCEGTPSATGKDYKVFKFWRHLNSHYYLAHLQDSWEAPCPLARCCNKQARLKPEEIRTYHMKAYRQHLTEHVGKEIPEGLSANRQKDFLDRIVRNHWATWRPITRKAGKGWIPPAGRCPSKSDPSWVMDATTSFWHCVTAGMKPPEKARYIEEVMTHPSLVPAAPVQPARVQPVPVLPTLVKPVPVQPVQVSSAASYAGIAANKKKPAKPVVVPKDAKSQREPKDYQWC